MDDSTLQHVLEDMKIPEFVVQAGQAALGRTIALTTTEELDQPHPERLSRIGFLYECQAIEVFQREQITTEEVRNHFAKAFICWRAMSSLPTGFARGFSTDEVSAQGLELLQPESLEEFLPPELGLAFRLAVSGLLSERTAEVRLELERFSLPPQEVTSNWRDQVTWHVFSAFGLLVRKSRGWGDINDALASINRLRELQRDYEDGYLDRHDYGIEQTQAAVELVGLYHLAQLVTLVGEYLRDGKESITQVQVRMDRHHQRAATAFRSAQRPYLAHTSSLLWIGCKDLAQNSIWTHVSGLGELSRQFAQLLASPSSKHPVIELWPGQQEALRNSFLDPYPRAVLVEMPTSSGKTLLAKFSIVQAKALNPTGVVAYVVPTRALVNQITVDLRDDLRGLGLRVEQAVPAFELDPAEDKLLEASLDVLVTTPEKLDLLVRSNHNVTRRIALVIADEAHNLSDVTRGPRLELLLGTIKRDRPDARFLLLSPFLPNNAELVKWLGDERALAPIRVHWKPSRKIVGTVDVATRGSNRFLVFETLPAADNSDIPVGIQIPIGFAEKTTRTISGLTKGTVTSLINRGSILVFCKGQGTSVKRARELVQSLPVGVPNAVVGAVCRYIEAEAGHHSTLVDCIEHGVAYHHAGLSHETRWLVESLIRRGFVRLVCGTGTLAQGMNFPITTVVMETLKKGDHDLTFEDFWNIAGRAGRTLVDSVGVVAFPAPNKSAKMRYSEFLQGEAEEIASQLAILITRADEIAGRFDLETLRDTPQLSALLQFLAHALRMSGSIDKADDVEDILRASLVYHQVRRQGQHLADKLIQLCKSYIDQIQDRRDILALADQTGFATPSVLRLLKRKSESHELSRPRNWLPERLFGNDIAPLTERVAAISDLPEINLGQGDGPPFNPERVAAILRDWVRGDTIGHLADRYSLSKGTDADQNEAEFSRYLYSDLLGRASWGMGALESVCLAGSGREPEEEIGYVPSMIYFGVRRKEAVWLRMAGVPRVVADSLGSRWQSAHTEQPATYDDIRAWVTNLTDSEWYQAIPHRSKLTPDDMRLLWHEFVG